jgi:hypothetical protein
MALRGGAFPRIQCHLSKLEVDEVRGGDAAERHNAEQEQDANGRFQSEAAAVREPGLDTPTGNAGREHVNDER